MGLFYSHPPQPVIMQQGTIPGQTTVIYGAPTYGYSPGLALVGDIVVAGVVADIILSGGKKSKKDKKRKGKKMNV